MKMTGAMIERAATILGIGRGASGKVHHRKQP